MEVFIDLSTQGVVACGQTVYQFHLNLFTPWHEFIYIQFFIRSLPLLSVRIPIYLLLLFVYRRRALCEIVRLSSVFASLAFHRSSV